MSNVMKMSQEEVRTAIKDGSLTVGVLGLGWMGLPTACLFAEAGAKVIGGDVDSRIIKLIKLGRSHIDEPGIQSIIVKHLGKRLSVTTNIRQVAAESDIIIIIVPTIVDNMLRPDYSAVERACKEIGLAIRRGSMIIVESTVGPGVIDRIVRGILETNSGFKAGTDFGLAYSPIRAMAGSALKDIQAYPRIIGGVDKLSVDVATAILASIVKGEIIRVRDLKTAEAVKLFENVYRDVNIALASELALFCEKTGLDFMEVRKAAITQPYCHLHLPRVGVGGHCIPFNPYFLITEAESVNIDLRLVKYARRVNDNMPSHIVSLVRNGLKSFNKSLKRSKIAILGISYRNDVKEAHNSPSITIIEILKKKGARIKVYDPFYSAEEIREMGLNAAESIERAVIGVDCVLIAVGHEQFKHIELSHIARLVRKPACIVDGWRIFDAEEVGRSKLTYYGVGLG